MIPENEIIKRLKRASKMLIKEKILFWSPIEIDILREVKRARLETAKQIFEDLDTILDWADLEAGNKIDCVANHDYYKKIKVKFLQELEK